MAEFDQYGRLIRRARPDLPNTHYAPASYTRTGSLNWWDRLNNFVIGIGNWFADFAEKVSVSFAGIAFLITIIRLVIWVFGVFSSEGFFWGVLSCVGAFFILGLSYYVIVVLGWLFGIQWLIFRFIFWNIYTLLLAIALSLGLYFYSCNSSSTNSYTSNRPSIELYEPPTTTYICTARTSLKVRRSPTLTAYQIGSLVRGQEVEVVDIADGFAHVKFKGSDGYASVKYLKKK